MANNRNVWNITPLKHTHTYVRGTWTSNIYIYLSVSAEFDWKPPIHLHFSLRRTFLSFFMFSLADFGKQATSIHFVSCDVNTNTKHIRLMDLVEMHHLKISESEFESEAHWELEFRLALNLLRNER